MNEDTIKLVIDIIGWGGMILLLAAYFLLTKGKWSGKSKSYQWCNIFGCIMLGSNALYYKALPSVGINVIWLFIGIWALWNMTRTPEH